MTRPMDAVNESNLHLSLPTLPGRYYWEIQVVRNGFHLRLKKRSRWTGRRNGWDSYQSVFISHDGRYLQLTLDTIEAQAIKLWEAEKLLVPEMIRVLKEITADHVSPPKVVKG